MDVETMPFFVARISFCRLTSPDIYSYRLPDVDLLSESRLEIHEKGDTYFSPLDTTTSATGNI